MIPVPPYVPPPRNGPKCSVSPHMSPVERDRPDACNGRRQGRLPAGMRYCVYCDTAPAVDPSLARQGPPNGGNVGL